MTKNTLISDLTVGELIQVIQMAMGQGDPKTVTGIEGIAQIFGVSVSTAKRIKSSGVISEAISQNGRTIVTDVELAQKLYSNATHGRKKFI